MSHDLSRRAVLGLAGTAAGVAAIGVPMAADWRSRTSTGSLLRSQAILPEAFTSPFRVPPVLTPERREADADHYRLTMREADLEILPGLRTRVWGYDGLLPGPTIVSRRGRRTVVRHRNELPVPAVVHLHGGHVPTSSDGFPLDLVMPLGSRPTDPMPMPMPMPTAMPRTGDVSHGEREYVYPMDQRAGTLWYHDHRMDFTGPAVWRGLAGFHLITDDDEERLGLPTGDRDLPIMIMDRSFAADGALRYPSLDPTLTGRPGVRAGFTEGVLGDVILVNGVPWPVLDVAAARYRLRFLNACNARRLRLALYPRPDGGKGLVQIGSDGGLLARPVAHEAIEFAPAERFDVVVDFGRYRPGQLVTLVNQLDDELGPGRVMRFRVGARVRDDSRVPQVLSTVQPLDPARAVQHRSFAFQAAADTGGSDGMPGWLINGVGFDPDRPLATPRLGDVEIWRFRSDFHHPVHLHLAQFQVLSRDGGKPGRYDVGWKDTVDLRPNQAVEVVTRFTGYAGRYVFHCHNLEHEDMAMMGTFETR